jgi:hypothetical protein
MKYLILSAALAFASSTAWAQDKKEATIKIVVEENGKQKVIERHFSDISKAEGELKKFTDSLDLDIKISGDKKKIIRMDVNKREAKGTMTPHHGNEVIIEHEAGDHKPGQEKRVMIIRKGDKDGNIISENIQGPHEFNIELDGPGNHMKMFRNIHQDVFAEGSKTIHGLKATPNKPFNGKISVKFNAPEKGNVAISILDVNGKEIASDQVKDFQGDYLGQIDLKKAGAGVYFLRVTQGNDGAVRRVKVD